MSHDKDLDAVRAAGAVVLTGTGPRRSVAVVHRPAYNDWSLPKGKCEKDEPAVLAAVREVEEETGVQVQLGAPLADIHYQVPKGPKVVHFWVGRVLRVANRPPDDEVDQVDWLPVLEARERLTYLDEQAVLDEALALPETVPFLITRHAKATARKDWSGDDRKRPLDPAGRKQAKHLSRLLQAYGVRQLKSSSSTRCLQTLAPYAETFGIKVKPVSLLSEEVGEDHLAGVERYIRKMAVSAGRTATPTAVCGHRPVLPAMLAGVEVPNQPMSPGTSLVVHVDNEGLPIAHEWHRV
ncbi:MAG: NUDIX domain-containing protein [Actinomycetia bacterium]|nr:NUDIX domain-containing protein [Actinomycetes bacterium]